MLGVSFSRNYDLRFIDLLIPSSQSGKGHGELGACNET
uniref:Uncharacterized protein n=1 Tax=Arundo donax TaxID=35708 RepID=A0A0A9EBC6_ARUDO